MNGMKTREKNVRMYRPCESVSGNICIPYVDDNLVITYNFLNLPKEIKKSGTVVSKYTYLSDGSKVSSCDADGNGYMYFGTARFTFDNEVPTFESIPFSGGRIVKTTNGYEPQYYLTDHLGSTRAIVNKYGQTVEATFDYTPFGVQIVDSQMPTNSTEYRFSGKELQNISDYEIYDFGARQYFPKYAIWSSVDPLSETYYPITPYAYCANNPIKYIDPDGRKLLFASGVSEQFKSKFEKTIKFMNEHKTSGDIAKLHASETVYYIKEGDGGFDPNNNTILWNPQQIVKTDNCILFPATILAHESKHALQKEENSPNDFFAKAQHDVNNEYGNKLEEEVITTTEQDAAKKHGDIKDGEVTRINHNGQIIEFTQKIPNGKILEDFRSEITLLYK
ncbi:MAG: RHS repeat-associated core domain-containing protein [Alistipes sp.]|nr:RHS repeat-associated core domain-containing protein [Alistipes sp.]